MARPKQTRRIETAPEITWFKPAGVPMRDLAEVTLTLDEVEAMRLADAEGMYHQDVAESMGVSRQTVGRILASAHAKIARALVQGMAIRVEGGVVSLSSTCTAVCDEKVDACTDVPVSGPPPESEPVVVAVPALAPEPSAKLSRRFAKAPYFIVVDASTGATRTLDNSTIAQQRKNCGGAVAKLLKDEGVDCVIAVQVGPKAARALTANGIQLFYADADVGDARVAFELLRRGELPSEG